MDRIAVWPVRLGMGPDDISKDQVPVMLFCGPLGGLAGWYFVSRHAKEYVKQDRS